MPHLLKSKNSKTTFSIPKLQGELKKAPFGMCTNKTTEGGKPSHADTKPNLILKRAFCNYLQVVGADVGHGPVGTLFLSLILFLASNPNYILLRSPSVNYLRQNPS